jgi:hypothetical protein
MRKQDPSSKSGKIRQLLKGGMKPAEIAKKVGSTPALVYNVKARMGGGKNAARKAGPRRGSRAAQINGLAGILDAVQSADRERARMRAVLEKVRSAVAGALA